MAPLGERAGWRRAVPDKRRATDRRPTRERRVALIGGTMAHTMPDDTAAAVPTQLTAASLLDATTHLAALDPDLGAVVARFGPPPMWAREPGFPTLVHVVLEQQVSLASARAAFDRLRAAADPLTPAALLALDDRRLREVGFSRQKTRYARALATAILEGTLDLDGLHALDDQAVDAALTAVPGIGPWTSAIYRLMVLRRPDAWPPHDIALHQAIAEVKGLPARPGSTDALAVADAWRPWRAVAARILWHHYLSVRGASDGGAPAG